MGSKFFNRYFRYFRWFEASKAFQNKYQLGCFVCYVFV